MQRRPLVVWAAARSRAAAQRTVAAEKAGGEAAQARRRVRAAAPSPMRRSVLRRREAQCLQCLGASPVHGNILFVPCLIIAGTAWYDVFRPSR